MSPIVAILLFLHVLGAIAVFGTTFALPLIGSMGGRDPMHANFATRVSLAIEEKIILPGAIVQLLTGLGLIVFVPFNLIQTHWLLLALIIYLVLLAFAYFVQAKSIRNLVEVTSTPPPAMAPTEGAGGPPAGPPPAVRAAVQRVQRGGFGMSIALIVIIFLMVIKPAF
ncbi:MAG TPA: DUF2269 family protein [Candidatus Limnocylindrales bacterium]